MKQQPSSAVMSHFYILLTVILALTLGSTAMFEGGLGGGFGYGGGHGLGSYYGYGGYPGFGGGWGYGGWGPWKHRKAARKHKKNHH